MRPHHFRHRHCRWVPLLVLPVLLLLTGCGESGTFVDEPNNAIRIFDGQPPTGITVTRSHYWTSSHFTHEYYYYAKLTATPAAVATLKTKHAMVQIEPNDLIQGQFEYIEDRPDWWAPGELADYEIWVAPHEFYPNGRSNLHLLIHRETGAVYLTDLQL